MYCVITGATGGFGKAFARRFAALGYDLCLTARSEDRLEAVKEELEAGLGVSVDVFPADLSRDGAPRELFDFTRGKRVDILVNCAGMSAGGFPKQARLDDEIKMLRLNVLASHALTRLYLDDMLARGEGKILNIASLSAWTPVPGIAAYSAGKAYILAFSRAIDYELRRMGSAVVVSVATPGFFATDIGGSGYRVKRAGPSVEHFAEKTLRKFLKGKRLIISKTDAVVPFLTRILSRRTMERLAFKNLVSNIEDEPKTQGINEWL
jgi:Short-chain dehydrogenases of various substrate specificities